MARGRFISNTLGDSRKFADLTNDLHRAAYMLLVAYADAEGRFIADSITLKGKLYTRCPWTAEQIESALLDMYRTDLIQLYTCGSKRYGSIVDFHKHNLIRRKDDGSPKEEAPSRIPAPPERVGKDPEPTPVPEPYRSTTGATPVECNGSRSVNGMEDEGKGTPDDFDSAEARTHALLTTGRSETTDAPLARAFFSRLIGTDNARHPQCRDNLTRWYQDFTEPEIRALWDAARQNPENKPRLYYFVDALNGLKPTTGTNRQHDGPTPEQVAAFFRDTN
jgi:hypothetical protein